MILTVPEEHCEKMEMGSDFDICLYFDRTNWWGAYRILSLRFMMIRHDRSEARNSRKSITIIQNSDTSELRVICHLTFSIFIVQRWRLISWKSVQLWLLFKPSAISNLSTKILGTFFFIISSRCIVTWSSHFWEAQFLSIAHVWFDMFFSNFENT